MLGSYSNDWRNHRRLNRRVGSPTTDFADTLRTTNEVNITGSLNLGARLTNDHEIGTISLLRRNTEDDTSRARTCSQGQFNDCFDEENPTAGSLHSLRDEQREMTIHQISGQHTLGHATLDFLGEFFAILERLRDSKVTWYYTDAVVETDLPDEVKIGGRESLDGPYGESFNYEVRASGTAADFRYSNLVDEVTTYGYDIVVPVLFNRVDIEISAGYDFTRKDRDYRQTSRGLGSTTAAFRGVSSAKPSEVFSDSNLMNPALGFELLLGVGEFGSESYKAYQRIEARYGKVDLMFNDTYRISGGLRQELFKQLSLPFDHLEYENSPIGIEGEADVYRLRETILSTDDLYPAFAFTYIKPGFWADEFQFRAGWSKTVARPDIREMSSSTYIDPITEARVRGNPGLEVSELSNFDIRLEWFWYEGDNITVSLFHKDVLKPIETVQGGATEDNIYFNFVNAEDAYVHGAEFEYKKWLGFLRHELGSWAETLYVAGNITVSDSEIFLPPGAGIGNITNERRRMTQSANEIFNTQIGFDSF